MSVHSRALDLISKGRLEDAKQLLSQVVAQMPNDHLAWSYMSLIAYRQGQVEIAIKLLDKSLSIVPRNLEALQNKGVFLAEVERFEESYTAFNKALKLDRKNAQTLNRFALAYKAGKEYSKALVLMKKAIGQDRKNPLLVFNLANIYREKGDFKDAVSFYERAITLNPAFKEAHNNLSGLLLDLGRFEEALQAVEQALDIFKDDPDLTFNKGKAFSGVARWEEALQCYTQVLKTMPGYTQAIVNKSNVLKRMLRYEDACQLLADASKKYPNEAVVRFNYAMALQGLGELEKAESVLKTFVVSDDLFGATAQFNLALNYLTRGLYRQGWEMYAARKEAAQLFRNVVHIDKPTWKGEPLQGKTLLVYWEQGVGDTLQFLRYLRRIDTQGGRLVFSCQKPLYRLLSKLTCVDQLIDHETDLEQIDLAVPLMDLPHIFATELDTIPPLDPDLMLSDHKDPQAELDIGVCWKGSETHTNDFNRSVTLDCLAPIFKTGHRFHSLQVSSDQEEVRRQLQPYGVEDLGSGFSDFLETYQALEKLDLVLTVDTSVAHLAGSMGKPVWLLVPFVSDFRWLKEREDSPWYPTVRLFRQPRIGAWQDVVEKVRQELEKESLSTALNNVNCIPKCTV